MYNRKFNCYVRPDYDGSLLYFRRLGYFPELVVCQDDTVPVIIFDVMEYSDTFLRGKVLLARIKYFGIRIGHLERVGYVMHIAFESDNHRLVRENTPVS